MSESTEERRIGSHELNARVAVLESRIESFQESIDCQGNKIDQLLAINARQKGFIAGIVFAIGALVSAFSWLLNGKFNIGGGL